MPPLPLDIWRARWNRRFWPLARNPAVSANRWLCWRRSANDRNGCAGGTVTVTASLPGEYQLYWGDENGERLTAAFDGDEIRACLQTLAETHAGTGYMHESFDKDDPTVFTRPWFAWANSLFAELLLRLCGE